MNALRKYLARRQLARVKHEIERLEHYRARSGAHLDQLVRHAAELQAALWYEDNPRPPAGTTLRGLNSRRGL